MKNPVFFTNKQKSLIINIYQYTDDSFIKIASLNENETTILNIPKKTYIIITMIDPKTEKKYEKTIFESQLENYHNHFRF